MDWADNIVHNMIIGTCESSLEPAYGPHSKIAAALRKAKADGMREAAETALNCEVTLDGDDPFGNSQIAAAISSRASQIEKGQT